MKLIAIKKKQQSYLDQYMVWSINMKVGGIYNIFLNSNKMIWETSQDEVDLQIQKLTKEKATLEDQV